MKTSKRVLNMHLFYMTLLHVNVMLCHEAEETQANYWMNPASVSSWAPLKTSVKGITNMRWWLHKGYHAKVLRLNVPGKKSARSPVDPCWSKLFKQYCSCLQPMGSTVWCKLSNSITTRRELLKLAYILTSFTMNSIEWRSISNGASDL